MNTRLTVGVDDALAFIEDRLDKRQVNKIQHAFPSPRFWSETEVPFEEVFADRRALHAQGRGMPINLYVGGPYCIQTDPGKCGYCLFPAEGFLGNIDLEGYFSYLKREVAPYKGALHWLALRPVHFVGR